MLRIFQSLVISLCLVHSSMALDVGDSAMNWDLVTGDETSLDYYQDSQDQVSVILFWATWCPYCAKLMPHIEEVYQQYKDKGVRFYAIDIFEDGKRDPVTYFKKSGYNYQILLVGDLVAEDYGVRGTPSLYVVDKDKKIIYKRKSGTSELQVKEDIVKKIEQAL